MTKRIEKRPGTLAQFLVDFLQDAGTYLFTFLGVLFSQYASLLLKGGKIDIGVMDWTRLALSAAAALLLVAREEGKGDPAGKAKHLKQRLSRAFAQGYAWNGMLGLATGAIPS